ncbi:hypothetical protein [Vibrio quintilis]|uniref:Uncharacterized protein n=1 Tax=Vibrio quintilis TaxID=1117707 RepID=A0A1M7YTX4_9VIBR|nr:hypothetical protein [Vibrio quintilis]SHO56048.1 hypothetical protein VQ7734_01811 [Vibrio quintilis]
MDKVQFTVGQVTFSYRLTPEQKKLASLTEKTTLDLSEWPEFEQQLTDAIQSAIPDELKLPTEKQLAYVRRMAGDLNLELPAGYEDSARICLHFFAEHKPAHDRVLNIYQGIRGNLLG